MHIWNLPLHCWGWNTVSDLLKMIGEVINIRRHTNKPSSVLSALVCLRPSVELPMLVELSVSMRQFPVLLTDNRSPVLLFNSQSEKFVLPDTLEKLPCAAHQIPAGLKGKHKQMDGGRKCSTAEAAEDGGGLIFDDRPIVSEDGGGGL